MLLGIPDGSFHDFVPQLNSFVVRYREPWEFMNHVEHICIPTCPNGEVGAGTLFMFGKAGQLMASYLLKADFDMLFRAHPSEDEFEAWEFIMGTNVRDGPPLEESDVLDFIESLKDNGDDLWSELEES